jgi:hypothetical protein
MEGFGFENEFSEIEGWIVSRNQTFNYTDWKKWKIEVIYR